MSINVVASRIVHSLSLGRVDVVGAHNAAEGQLV